MMNQQGFAIIPFNSDIIKGKHFVSNMLGAWDFLDEEEFKVLTSLKCKKETPLFNRLYERGLIADERNLKRLLKDYQNLNAHLFHDTSLHIAVVTTRCNLQCKYCQTKLVPAQDMSLKVAARVLKSLFDVKSPAVTLEFQGGEPLLNWETLAFLIEEARKINTTNKELHLALVSNVTLLDDEKLKFLIDFNVDICTSLDGPRKVHDANRIFHPGKGSYDIVSKRILEVHKKSGKRVSLLPTITRYSLNFFKEIIDEYVKFGETQIPLRPVNKIGNAALHWERIGYSAEEFMQFYKNSLDYILALNKKGIFIKERVATFILKKMLEKQDAAYTELMNPCGAGRGQMVYMPDGSCYPCDESRMLGEEMFKLGNILEEDYGNLIKKENLLHLLESSAMNLWDYNSVFSPWMGTCPVVNYYMQNNFVPKIWCSSVHKIYNFQFRYICEKILEDKKNLNIFENWVKEEVAYEPQKQ